MVEKEEVASHMCMEPCLVKDALGIDLQLHASEGTGSCFTWSSLELDFRKQRIISRAVPQTVR